MRQCVKAAVSATNVPFAGLRRVQHAPSRLTQQDSSLTVADRSVRGIQYIRQCVKVVRYHKHTGYRPAVAARLFSLHDGHIVFTTA
jgi:hypothetical protein